MRKVLVLGSNGFLGRTLCATLGSKGHFVKPLSRQEVDLGEPTAQARLALALAEVDTVVILTAITPDKGKDASAFERNIQMLLPILKALQAVPVEQVIYISSDAVYHPSVSWVDENTLPSPADAYGCMHLSREQLLREWVPSLWIVRPTLIYGQEDSHNAYGPNRFMRSAIQNQMIQLFGEGEEKRSHIAVEDVAALLCQGIEQRQTGISLAVTSPSYSFKAVAEQIIGLLPFNVALVCQERKNPITHRHFETSGLLAQFPHFRPRPLQVGLQQYVQACLSVEV